MFFVFIYLSCVSKQGTSTGVSGVTPNPSIDNEKSIENVEQEDSQTISFTKLYCATQHISRSISLVTSNSPSSEEFTGSYFSMEHLAGVYLYFDVTNDVGKTSIIYGDLYRPLDSDSNEKLVKRTIFLEEIDTKTDTSKIIWKQSLDKYARPNKIIDEADRYMIGEISIDVTGKKNGFYSGKAQFSSTESQVDVSCWTDTLENPYVYNEGTCKNEQGEEGYNPWTLEMIRITKNGECSDLSGEDLNDGFYDYPVLDWNLKGANLNGSDVVFSNMFDVQLEGAVFTDMTMGYVQIEGSIDKYTKYNEICEVNREGSQVNCSM
jgi:hypothetical protein